MKLTIAVAAYQIESFVEECLKSVAAQTLQDFEFLVIDDGSKDKTGEIIDAFAKTCPKVKVLHQKNAGISLVRNTMIDICETPYLWMIDGDDTIPPDAMEKLLPCLDGERDAVYFSYTKYGAVDDTQWTHALTDLNEAQIRSLRYKSMLRDSEPVIQRMNANSSVMCAHKVAVIKENGIQFEPGRMMGQDMIFTAMCLRHSKKIAYLDDSLYFYRVNEGSVSLRFSRNILDSNLVWLDNIKKFVDENYSGDEHMYKLMYGRFLGTASSIIMLDICHPLNPDSYAERRKRFLDLASRPQIKDAIEKCPDSLLGRNPKFFKAFLKTKCFFLANLYAHIIIKKRYFVFRSRGGKIKK